MARRWILCVLLLISAGWASPGPQPDAGQLLTIGEWRRALPLLEGSDRASRLLRAEALLQGRLVTQADPLVERLRRETEATPSLADHRYLMVLGRWASLCGETELAERAFAEAHRRAAEPDQALAALDAQLALATTRQRWDKALAVLTATQKVVPKASPLQLADHLKALAEYQQARGLQPEALACLSAARSLYLDHQAPLKAAETRLQVASALGSSDRDAEWSELEAAVMESLTLGDPDGLSNAVSRLSRLAVSFTRKKAETAARLAEVRDALPSGPLRTSIELECLRFQMLSLGETNAAREGVEAILKRADLDEENRLIALHLAAGLAATQGQEQSLVYWRKALELAPPRHSTERHITVARGLIRLGIADCLRDLGDFEGSLEEVRAALDEMPGEDWRVWRVIQGHYQALLALIPLQDLGRAKAELREALNEARELETAEQRANFVTAVLASLSVNRSLEQDLLDPAERALGAYDPFTRALLDELLVEGDQALKDYDSWLEALRQSNNQTGLVRAMTFKALFLEAAGRTAEARALLLEALAMADKEPAGFSGVSARLLLARLESLDGRPEVALVALQQAARMSEGMVPGLARFQLMLLASYQRQQGLLTESVASYEKAAAAEPDEAWGAHFGAALALRQLGRRPEALALVERALRAEEVSRRNSSRARMQALRGLLLADQGRAEEALVELEKALPVLQLSGSLESVVEAALAQGDALLALGRPEQALSVSREALESLLARQTASAESTRPLFERVAMLSLQTGQREQALYYLDLSRSAELVSSVRLAQIEHQDPATAKLLESLDQLKVRLEGLRAEAESQDKDSPSKTGLSRALAQTREQFFAKLDELKRVEPDFEALVQLSGSDLSALQAALDERTALLEYFPAEDSLYLFVVSQHTFGLHRMAIGRAELARTVKDYGDMVRDPDSDQTALATSSHALHSLLLEPALKELTDKTVVLVVPSGPLWNVRFEELRDARGQCLNDVSQVAVLTSADLLASLTRAGDRELDPVVLVGAPDAEDLPGARAELDSLATLLPRNLTLLGPKATSGALKANASRAKVLHIASHSGLGKTPGQSYISLADGPFELERIYGLSLPPGALVVLSSCRSALGETAPGREVTSLASAFNIAGASTVIASHWEVDDQVTRQLFLRFYGHLKDGKSRGEALRLARRETSKEHPHPYYWAAFSLFGNPK